MKEETEDKLTVEEVESVLQTMQFYRRLSGYISRNAEGRLLFYDSEPSFGGCYVTIEQIKDIINQLQNT
jgi:hypothetical protein